jgi:hypothetical protein
MHYTIVFRTFPAVILATALVSSVSASDSNNVIPSQFIAKMYTEALGRAPDQVGWHRYVDQFQREGCDLVQLTEVGQEFYRSEEFESDYRDNEAKLLALYRGALNRDPDQDGLTHYLSLLTSGAQWMTVVREVFSSEEFAGTVPSICSKTAPNYHFGDQPPPVLTPGSRGFVGAQAALQATLNAAEPGATIEIAQKAVVPLTSTLIVPSGITLRTHGAPSTTSYALMARLVRAATFVGPNVAIQGGGKLVSVWVDGQRNVLGYYKIAGGDADNANIATLGGINTEVAENKLSDPQGGTNFFSDGGDAGSPCSNQVIRGNLITAYSASHGFEVNADGLTMNCEGLDVENNHIVDVSDIGIVLFATPGVRQHSKISKNVIVSAGISINAPISSDPSTGNPGGSSLDYRGTIFRDNIFWTGPNTAFDFGIEAGAREFFRLPANNSDGTGATYVNNTTGLLSARVRAGIAVAGMLDVTISNDDRHPLAFIPVNFAPGMPAAACPGGEVIVEASDGHASGTYPTPTVDGDFDGCVNGPFAQIPAGEIQLSPSPLTYDSESQVFKGTITLRNISSATINGPFEILFESVSAGATLVNATATLNGTPYLLVPGVLALTPTETSVINVEFTDSSNLPIIYKPVTFAGVP